MSDQTFPTQVYLNVCPRFHAFPTNCPWPFKAKFKFKSSMSHACGKNTRNYRPSLYVNSGKWKKPQMGELKFNKLSTRFHVHIASGMINNDELCQH